MSADSMADLFCIKHFTVAGDSVNIFSIMHSKKGKRAAYHMVGKKIPIYFL